MVGFQFLQSVIQIAGAKDTIDGTGGLNCLLPNNQIGEGVRKGRRGTTWDRQPGGDTVREVEYALPESVVA